MTINQFHTGSYPTTRMRRNRLGHAVRLLTQENHLSTSDLIWPVCVTSGTKADIAVAKNISLTQYTLDSLASLAKEAWELGILAIAPFPYIQNNLKTHDGSESLNPDSLMCNAIKAIKQGAPEIMVIADIALDPYTSHGHDGILIGEEVDNEATIEQLCKLSLILAEAGADTLAPSDMMDGRILKIRQYLDAHDLQNVRLLSYAAKYASGFYGPFRDAIGAATLQGDKKSYQMNPANSDEALREIALDIQEGADLVMIKPGMLYMDIIQRARQSFAIPIFAYQVSGEYAMLNALLENNGISKEAAILEPLLSLKRAGACGIFTYFAREAAILLNK